jgi:uncharacterized protein with WD repeat
MKLIFDLKNNVKNFCMSTNETHIISFTGMNDKDLNKENVFIWDLLGDELIRGFTINKDEKFENFKWSPNGKFFGRIKKDILIIYDSPKMQIIPVIINLFYKNYSKLNDI